LRVINIPPCILQWCQEISPASAPGSHLACFVVVAIDRIRRARSKATAFEQRETVQESPSLGDTSGAVRCGKRITIPRVRAIPTLASSNHDSFTRLALELGLQPMPEFRAASGAAAANAWEQYA
jgi:hypothetical protein